MSFSIVELVGYLASLLIVASLAMKSVVRLRVVSLLGSIVFVVYGVLLGSIPLIITNVAAAGLNIWYLRQEFRPDRDIGAVPIEAEAPFLQDFLSSHREDINRFHPGFSGPDDGDFVRLLTRDGLPAGAVIGRPDGTTLHLSLDYVMSAFRDSRIGAWLYGAGSTTFTAAGFTTVTAQPESEALRSYLLRQGFEETADGLTLTVS
ncbi:MAG TPA: hypothetical protein PKD84_05330 [Propionicimonas sp.]|jgi:hypothetical protein|nr:hypothetical protein [Propionicimonas sp.]